VLVLSSHEPINWTVHIPDDVIIDRVILVCLGKSKNAYKCNKKWFVCVLSEDFTDSTSVSIILHHCIRNNNFHHHITFRMIN